MKYLDETPHRAQLAEIGIRSLDEVATGFYQSLVESSMGDHFKTKEGDVLADVAGQGQGSLQYVEQPGEALPHAVELVYVLDEPIYDPRDPQESRALLHQPLPDAQEGETELVHTPEGEEVVYTINYTDIVLVTPIEEGLA